MSLESPSLAMAQAYIYAIDFSMIIEKMVKQDGWRQKDAEATCSFYRNFLYLNKKYANGQVLPPSVEVDEFWHYHILDTQKYLQDCDRIFGYYFHHYPYLVLDHNLNQQGLDLAFEQTQVLHQQEFGEPMYSTRSKFAVLRQNFRTMAKS